MYTTVYMMHSLFCHTVTDEDGAYICRDGAMCIDVRVCVCVCVCVSVHAHTLPSSREQQLLSVWSGLSTRRSCLEGDELS